MLRKLKASSVKRKTRTVRCRECGKRISCQPGTTSQTLTDHYKDAHGKKPPLF